MTVRSILQTSANQGTIFATIALLLAALFIAGPGIGAAHAQDLDALAPTVYDDFLGETLDESLWAHRGGTAQLDDGVLVLTAPNGLANLTSTLSLDGDRYTVRATVSLVENGQSFLGFSAGTNYIRLSAAAGGAIRADFSINGVYQRFLTLPGAIDPKGTNDFAVEREGDAYRFYVNGSLVHEEEIAGFATADVNLLVQTFSSGAVPAKVIWNEVRYGVSE